VVFVEIFRLLLVLAGVAGGLQLAHHLGEGSPTTVLTVTLLTLVAYVVGGVAGRVFDTALRRAVTGLHDMPPAEVFAGSLVGSTGLLLGLALGLAVVALVHSTVGYPLAAVLAWVLCVGGVRLGVTKGNQIVRAAGMGHLLERPSSAPGGALVVDTSALLEQHLLALGRSGLLAGGVVVPRFVLDEAAALVGGPEAPSARRARAGLEALEALRRLGVSVRVEESEVPECAEVGDKALVLAGRLHLALATCSAELERRAGGEGTPVVNLRRLAAEMAPRHPPGERVAVDLVKPGRRPGQAVGYLPDGTMVVVNDAEHLLGRARVAVVVDGSRPTSQGTLLFARLEGARAEVLSPAG
jgi:uncharacterized protein YacL